MTSEIHPDAINSLLNGVHGAPFDLLGCHAIDEKTVSIRAFQPTAQELSVVVEDGDPVKMTRVRDEGFFEVSLKGQPPLNYHFVALTGEGIEEIIHDSYGFAPQLTEYDLYLHSEGRHLESYNRLGAHLREVDGVQGVHFAVWAPNAFAVSVIGGFNRWDGRVHPMLCHVESGIWELFVPGAVAGDSYKYLIRSRTNDYKVEKADPYGFYSEMRPRTASVVVELDNYQWGDGDWMQSRQEKNWLNEPMNIYELHPGSWRRDADDDWLTYRELADHLIEYIKEMNYTHIELLPIMEHPFDGSWGYQVTGYYAVTSRFGTPEDFMYFVDQCHQNDIGVILDWVPAHFPKDGFALSYFDGTHLYEHADPRKGEHPDWGTYIFNYGRNEVRNFLIANALFWLDKYHIDGLRVDAVSSMLYLDFGRKEDEWVPNEYGGNENMDAVRFLQEFNHVIHEKFPGAVTIAEESTSWAMVSRPTYLGGLGFTLKWNMGWMHDTLKYIQKDPVYRRYHHNSLTFSLMYAFSENFVLSLSHDEVVHGKGSLINKAAGDWWQKFATMRLLFGYQVTHPGKQLIFMGAEFGQFAEWSETRSLDWHLVEEFETHQNLQNWVKDLNRLYKEEPALWEEDFSEKGFRWIEPNDAEQSTFSYLRFASDPDDFLVIICNFTPVPRYHYRIGVPQPGLYREILNSDSHMYGGGNVGSDGARWTEHLYWHNEHQSLSLVIPPLGIVVLKRDKDASEDA